MRDNPPSSTRRVRSAHESKSATVRAAAAAPSRRQQSRWRREQSQQRVLYIGIGVLVALIAAIFVGGIVYDNVYRANQVVAQVGSDSITASQLLDEIRPQVRALEAQAKQLGGTSNQQIAGYVDQQKRSLPDQVLNSLIDVHIVQQEATRRGMTVTPAEVDDKVRRTVADFQASTNPTPTVEPTATPEASATDQTNPVLTSATPQPTTLPISAALTPTTVTTPTAVPTLEESAYPAALQQLLDRNNLTEADLRTQLERGLLQDKVQAAIGQDQVPDTQQQVHTRQIVVATSDQANDLLNQLRNGADFATLATANSTDTATRANGGDMGWIVRGQLSSKPIEDAAFSLQPGQLSGVIQDSTGYHILQGVDSDPNRAVPADQLTTLRQKAFSDWETSQRSGQGVKISLDDSERNWVLARIGVRP
jgi:parvulin-like peptidyl-prolyl isomerase